MDQGGRPGKTMAKGSFPTNGEHGTQERKDVNKTDNPSPAREEGPRAARRSPAKLWVAFGIAIAAVASAWLAYSYHQSEAAVAPAALPQVVVSKPLVREVESRLGFLGQFSAVEQVELRGQVGGTLTGIHFKDGDIVQKGDLLFSIDSRPYEIRLAQANALLETATARFVLADRDLNRAHVLKRSGNLAITEQTVDQRTNEQRAAQAAVDDAKAQIRDAEFDLEHCRIAAPFTGRIGTHLVSVGNLIAGSRAATSPTTLLTTLVSLDPIYLDFDVSESDFLTYSRDRARRQGSPADKVVIALTDETQFNRQGTLDFVDNALDRSSGTIHARATVANPDHLLTPGEFARLRLVVGAPVQALLVPDAAVLPDQSQHIVMTVAPDSTVVAKPVEIGDLRDGLRVIRSGLTPNDQVIIDGIPQAAPRVKVAPQDGTIRYAAGGAQG
jgi:multidrug efflux system membrane fusion protein